MNFECDYISVSNEEIKQDLSSFRYEVLNTIKKNNSKRLSDDYIKERFRTIDDKLDKISAKLIYMSKQHTGTVGDNNDEDDDDDIFEPPGRKPPIGQSLTQDDDDMGSGNDIWTAL